MHTYHSHCTISYSYSPFTQYHFTCLLIIHTVPFYIHIYHSYSTILHAYLPFTQYHLACILIIHTEPFYMPTYHSHSTILHAYLPFTTRDTTVLRPAPTPLLASHRYWPWCSRNAGCMRSVPFGNICTPLLWIDKSWYSLGCLPGPKLATLFMLFDTRNLMEKVLDLYHMFYDIVLRICFPSQSRIRETFG
jgi:hypothetical protein